MRARVMAVTTAMAALTAFVPAHAAADVIHVGPGESIQAAIDQAGSYDTIKLAAGTYDQNVQIKTDGITLQGAGPNRTLIKPPATPNPVCGAPDSVNGICVTDAQDTPQGPVVNRRVQDVQVKSLDVSGFSGTGVFFFGTDGQRVSGVSADGDADYGIAAFDTTGGRYWGNVTSRNGEAGIYVGDSPQANALVHGNTSFANVGFGIFVRDASHGAVTQNVVFDNCIGILFLNTGGGSGNSDWLAQGNIAIHNNAACAGNPGEGEPSFTGAGIVIGGASHITLLGNTADGNAPAQGVDSPATGGISVISFPGEGGGPGQTASDNKVVHNTALGNTPFDLTWDQQGDNNTFAANRCQTSSPDGLCGDGNVGEHGGGHGDRGHGDHGDHGGEHASGHHGRHGKGSHHRHHRHKHKHHKHQKHNHKHTQKQHSRD